ncbi:MAG: transposase [Acidimicrobiaceae bacterium]|nr:transposase [Acidimicrobiaceae bacterium]
MEIVVERIAGLDVHAETVVACVRTPGPRPGRRRQEVRTFGTFAGQLAELADWLGGVGVTEAVMEATGVYWKPVWYALDGAVPELVLVNATQVKKVPGRKTDVKDAEWLAQLGECGLLRASFVPPEPIRDLRDLTRYRKKMVQARAQEAQRVQKLLEDAGVKLTEVISDVLGRSGRAMLDALVAGQRDPAVLAELALGKMRPKIPVLREALATARFRDHHAWMLSEHLARIDSLDGSLARIDAQVDRVIAPFGDARDRLMTIPGVGKTAAEVIIAETGGDMAQFPTPEQLASWAGMCPGNKRSAGKNYSGRTPAGNAWLSGMVTECGWAARRTKGTYLAAQFWHIARRRGQARAAVAVGHSILVIAWHIMSTPGVVYDELGGDYFTRRLDPTRHQHRLVAQLEALGLKVTLEPAAP